MAWVAVDQNKREWIYVFNPIRTFRLKGGTVFIWVSKDIDPIRLPLGSIEKLIGKKLTWDDEPVELKERKGEFTTLYDSFGTPIHEGDTVEYYDWCHASGGTYHEGPYECELANLPEGFIERAKTNGYPIENRWEMVNGTECILMHKPKVGVVKWNSEMVTYEPIIKDDEDYDFGTCFHPIVINGERGSYCKVISK